MDVLTEPVSVVFQENARIKVELLSERENNYNIFYFITGMNSIEMMRDQYTICKQVTIISLICDKSVTTQN
jgi:hypothetical protein